MSTLKTTNIQHASAASANIVLDSSSNAVVGGTLGCTGNLTVTSGNVILSNGNGIDFSATGDGSGTASSELFDDYEEGTWTPILRFGGGTTGITYNASYTGGRYTKIGNRVLVSLGIELTNKGSSTGSATIAGLPYTIASGAIYAAASVHGYSFTYTGQFGAELFANTTYIQLSQVTEAGSYSALTNTNFTNGSIILLSAQYNI